MKKTLIILLTFILVFIIGCRSNVDLDTLKYEDEGKFLGKTSEYGTNLNLDNINGLDVVIDEKLALEIANTVIKSLYGENAIYNTVFTVYEPEDEEFIVVYRYQKEVIGGGINVAINKKDGAVLKVWPGIDG